MGMSLNQAGESTLGVLVDEVTKADIGGIDSVELEQKTNAISLPNESWPVAHGRLGRRTEQAGNDATMLQAMTGNEPVDVRRLMD